ncbi:MAG: DUF805 domain-containing protein [Synechococcaceae bacterium WB9_2_170]|jgi:uncharacterized membrane protein YhaH (DUF805 family)|nr:DUF805 domain-containing protein [Synechococcaceae bacterium WB9_2_170]
MPLINAFSSAWVRSFDYTGRSTRGEFWWFVLADIIVALLLTVLAGATAQSVPGLASLPFLYSIAQIVPHLPLAIRRIRDSGKPWPWIFIQFVPVIGVIWLFVLFVQPSIPG